MLTALLCLTTTDADADALPRRKSTLKWAQDRELLFITVPLKRGAETRCVDEVARVVGKRRLKFETRCGDEVYELDYALANDVIAKSVTLKADARRATALLTVKKAKRGRKWTQLVAKPEAARGLIEKDWSRWEDEEDEEDAAEAAAAEEEKRRQAARERAALPPARDAAEAEARRRDAAMAEVQSAGRVSAASLAQLRGDASANPRDAPALLVLASALLRNREYAEATPLLERAIELAPSLPGAHALLATALRESGGRAFDGARATEAEAQYRASLKLSPRGPETAEAYYQLGLLTQRRIPKQGVGGPKDEASHHWQAATAVRPTMAEAHTLLAARLSRAKDADARARAKAAAQRAIKLDPRMGTAYAALATALADGAAAEQLAPATLAKCVSAMRTAVSLEQPGTAPQRAYQYFELATFLAAEKKWSHDDTLEAFAAASRLDPASTEIARARADFERWVHDDEHGFAATRRKAQEANRKADGARRAAAHAEALKEVEAAEAAAAEGDEDEYAEVRIHKKKKPPKEKPTERAAKEKSAARAGPKPTARAPPKGGGENVRLGTAGRLFMET